MSFWLVLLAVWAIGMLLVVALCAAAGRADRPWAPAPAAPPRPSPSPPPAASAVALDVRAVAELLDAWRLVLDADWLGLRVASAAGRSDVVASGAMVAPATARTLSAPVEGTRPELHVEARWRSAGTPLDLALLELLAGRLRAVLAVGDPADASTPRFAPGDAGRVRVDLEGSRASGEGRDR